MADDLNAWIWGKIDHFDEHGRNWLTEATETFRFEAGDQWDYQDKKKLKDENRPCVTFNRIFKFVNAIVGHEVLNREKAVMRAPKTRVDLKPVCEAVNIAADEIRSEGEFDVEDTAAARDAAICGIGWAQTVMDYGASITGEAKKTKVPALEMGWDLNACKPNLSDRSWHFHKSRYTVEEFTDRWPDHGGLVIGSGEARPKPASTPHHNASEDQYAFGAAENNSSGRDPVDGIDVYHFQWKEPVDRWLVEDMATGKQNFVGSKEIALNLQAVGATMRREVGVARVQQTVYRQAYLAERQIIEGPTDLPGCFTYTARTAYYDTAKKQWFGHVRAMLDPQRWANVFFSSLQHDFMTSGKGILAETDAVKDQRKFEKDYSSARKVKFVNPGAIRNGKIQPTPHSGPPPSLPELMAYSIDSISDTGGFSPEFMGMAGRNQPGVLEDSRSQATIATLGQLYDSIARAKREDANILFTFMKEYYPVRVLVDITGPDYAQAIQRFKAEEFRYRTRVEDVPSTSDSRKTMWNMIMGMMPILSTANLPARVWLALLEYSPMPSTLLETLGKALQPSPEERQAKAEARQLESAEKQAEIAEKQAGAFQRMARGQKDLSEIGPNAAKIAADEAKTYSDALENLAQVFAPETLPYNAQSRAGE